MLTRNPKEFERVAHEWAVKYAGAQKKDLAEGSGRSKPETKEEKKKRSKEEEAAERAAMSVHKIPYRALWLIDIGTVATMNIWSTASSTWALIWIVLCLHLITLESILMMEKTTTWRKHTLEISLQGY